jgi:YhgE/Pip-like protein
VKKYNLFIVVVILILIPFLYSNFFLGALKDPYQNVEQLPVAVVKGDNKIPIEESLLRKKLFKAKFENIEKANSDLNSGKVYGIVSFDNNFMEKIASEKETPNIVLTTNESLNSFAAKILTSEMTQYVTKVNEVLSKELIPKFNAKKVPVPDKISSLINLKHQEVNPVKNNAEAMAPYFFSLTLFIGCIFISQFVMKSFPKKEEEYFHYWKKEFIYALILALAQVFVLLVTNNVWLKLRIDYVPEFIIFTVIVSATFCSIIVGLNKLIPGIGSFLVLLLTMLQTSSSGGTYPIQLSNPFFQGINKLIPMTYTNDGFRKLMSIGSTAIQDDVAVLVIYFVISQVLILLSFHIHHKNKATKLVKI